MIKGNERSKIIIVIDDRLLPDIEKRLKRLPLEIVARAGSTEEALSKVKSIPADLVLIDIGIEGEMDGIETAQSIRRLYDIPIVFISDQHEEDIIDRAKSAEPFGFIFKPIRDRVFQITLEMALSRGHEEKLRKSAENELERTAKEWRATFDAISDSVALIEPNGAIVRCNTAMTRLLGKSYNEIIGYKCWELVHGTNEPIENCPYVRMKESLSRESMILPVNDHRYHVTVDPLCDSDGNLLSAAHIMMDITWQKQAEEAIRESEERTRATFNAITDSVFLHPLLIEGFAPFLDVNETACERYGYTREEFLSLKAPDITIKSDAESHSSRMHRKKLRDSGRLIFESIHISKSGEKFPVEINTAIIELGGRPVILAVARDISERKQIEAEREKLIIKLQDALREIKELRGFLPICSNCKKIRDDEGYWQQMEKYIMDRTDAQFSHSICPDCATKLYPDIYDE